MEKFCIFCGKKPENKSHEHVIPQWLIKLTGDPNREVYLGLNWTGQTLEERKFSFSAFKFPACQDCNEGFSGLEDRANPIVEAILSRAALSEAHWDTFLDWLDKVRIGLWLGMIYLNENRRGLTPHFHIRNRIGSKDRFVIVYESIEHGHRGVNWGGTETPLFEHVPSCFTLSINNFLFLNSSNDFLFSRRFGFPFPTKRELQADERQCMTIEDGTRKVQFPLIHKRFKTGGTQLFQPMIPYAHFRSENGEQLDVAPLYDNDYVKSNCMDFSAGRGHIFRRHGNQLVQYPSTPSKDWLPKQKFPLREVFLETGVLTGELLEQLYRDHPAWDSIPEDARATREAEFKNSLLLHATIMENLVQQKRRFY